MSFHSGDWANLCVAALSAIAAIAASIAAFQSSISAKESLKQQNKSLLFEQKRHYMELLRSEASKANASVHKSESIDWNFNQVANVAYSIDTAKQFIKESELLLGSEESEGLKTFFKDQLCYEIITEMNQKENIADCFVGSRKGLAEFSEVYKIWMDNLRFFDFI